MGYVTDEPQSEGRAKRVTLQDIAKIAGVHVMTVSDALNGTRRVAPATREKVRQIAKELNYVPNSAARALVTGRTGIIAVLSGAMNEPYYANMVHAMEALLNLHGYKLLLLRTPHEVKDLVSATGNTTVDGAIAIDMYHLVDEFRARPSLPCVSIGTFSPSFVDHVIVDLSTAVKEALQIMLDAGRQRIAYMVTAEHMTSPEEVRARAYLETMENAGRTPEIINVSTDLVQTVRNRFSNYVQEHGCPDALLCMNDETAICAYRVLRDFGKRIPEDVLLVGCDGQTHMEFFDPPLTTIVQPMKEICSTAWQLLRLRMASPDIPIQQKVLQAHLLVRQSLVSADCLL